ncbi:MAG: DUF2946 family protein [Rubripirellula sp.]
MTTLRLVFVSLLSSMIFIGHAPAWLHLAGCSHGSDVLWTASEAVEGNVCSHGCLRHNDADTQSGDFGSVEESSLPAEHEHNSDTCAVCQLLVAPTGLQWQNEVVVVGDVGLFQAPIADPLGAIAAQILLPQPRGPPASCVS